MMDKSLLKRLAKLGYPLFETEEAQDVNATFAEVVQTEDLRLWEGFPVVLATSVERHLFDYNTVKSNLKNASDRSNLDRLFVLSLALYKALNLKFPWADEFYKHLAVVNMSLVEPQHLHILLNLQALSFHQTKE